MGNRFNWQAPSPIHQVDISKNLIGKPEAMIYAPDTVDEKTSTLPQYLKDRGFICHIDEIDGNNVIKVHMGFPKREKELIDAMQSGGFTVGAFTKAKIPDRTPKLSLFDTVRRYGQNMSGVFGDVGHLAIFTQGALLGDKNRMTTGVVYGMSASISAIFGSGANALHFTEMVSDWQDYMEKEGYTVSDPLMKTPVAQYRERNFSKKAYDYIKAHPIAASQAFGLWGNSTLALSGIQEMRMSDKIGMRRFAPGASGFARAFSGIAAGIGSLIAIFVKEATPDEKKEYKKEEGFWKTLKKGDKGAAFKMIPHRIHGSFARSPLAVLGTLLLADNMSMLTDAAQAKTTHDKWLNGAPAKVYKNKIAKWLNGGDTGAIPPHKQRIAALDSELASGSSFNASDSKEALKQQYQIKQKIKLRDNLSNQVKGVEKLRSSRIPDNLFPWITGGFWTAASTSQTLATKRNKALETKEVWEELYTHVANTILGMPQGQQVEAVKKAAIYLSSQVDPNADEIEAGIRSKVDIMTKSPWLAAITNGKPREDQEADASQQSPDNSKDNSASKAPGNDKKFMGKKHIMSFEGATTFQHGGTQSVRHSPLNTVLSSPDFTIG